MVETLDVGAAEINGRSAINANTTKGKNVINILDYKLPRLNTRKVTTIVEDGNTSV